MIEKDGQGDKVAINKEVPVAYIADCIGFVTTVIDSTAKTTLFDTVKQGNVWTANFEASLNIIHLKE